MVSASHFIYSQVVNRRFFDNMVGDNVLVCNKSLSSANGGMQEITLSSAKILHYSNHKFLGKQALELVQKLKTNLTLE